MILKLNVMKMTERVKKLREQSLNAVETISVERAVLMTQFCKSDEARELSAPVKRAKAFEYLLKNKKICINDGELIVGERGPGHTVLGYKMFRTGFLQLKEEIKESLSKLDFYKDPQAYEKQEELKAMDMACDTIIMYANRHADELEKLAGKEKNSSKKRTFEDGGGLQKGTCICP